MNAKPLRIRIPAMFLSDYEGRWPCEAPKPIRSRGIYAWVRADDPHLPALLADAKHYASEGPYMGPEAFGLTSSARATVRALTPHVESR